MPRWGCINYHTFVFHVWDIYRCIAHLWLLEIHFDWSVFYSIRGNVCIVQRWNQTPENACFTKTWACHYSSGSVFDQSLFPVFSEINRVRKDMYSDTVNGLVDKHPLELPEPMGPIVHLQEKLFVPVKEYPDVSETAVCYIANNISVFRSCSQVLIRLLNSATFFLFSSLTGNFFFYACGKRFLKFPALLGKDCGVKGWNQSRWIQFACLPGENWPKTGNSG